MSKTAIWAVAAAISLTLLLLPAKSDGSITGVNRWSTSGPVGVAVSDLATDPRNPNVVYAAGGGSGLYSSADGGGKWVAVPNPAVPGWTVTYVAADPVSPSVLYVFDRAANTLYKSSDNGTTWAALGSVHEPPLLLIVGSDPGILVVPSQPRTIYIANYVSVNGGSTFEAWTPDFTPLDGQAIAVTLISAATPVQYVSYFDSRTVTGVVYRHDSNGFRRANYQFSIPGGIWSDHRDPSTSYVVHGFVSSFVKTTDGGQTWTVLPVPGTVQSFVADPAEPTRLYATVILPSGQNAAFRSSDGGSTWQPLGVPGSVPMGNRMTVASSRTVVYLATASGVYDFRLTETFLSLLEGRFSVVLDAVDPRTGRATVGYPVSLGDRAGYFALPEFTGDPTFPEVIVKMADATAAPPPFGGSFWFFHSPMTDVHYTLTVTDQRGGLTRTYSNAGSPLFCGGADTNAFPP